MADNKTSVAVEFIPELEAVHQAISGIVNEIKNIINIDGIINFTIKGLEKLDELKNLNKIEVPIDLKIDESQLKGLSPPPIEIDVLPKLNENLLKKEKTNIPVFFQIQNYKQVQEAKKLLSKKMNIPIEFDLKDIPPMPKPPKIDVPVEAKVDQKKVQNEADKMKQSFATTLKGLGGVLGGMFSLGFINKIIPMSDMFIANFGKVQGSVKKLKSSLADAFQPFLDSLKPVMDEVAKVVDSITKWIDKNPQLATAITVVVVALVGLTIAVGGLTVAIGVLEAVGAPVFLIIGAIALLAFAIWDLWNGFETGESVVANLIAGFLEFFGISVSAEEVLAALKGAFEALAAIVEEYVVPVLVAQFQYFYDVFAEIFATIENVARSLVEVIVGLFTGDMQRAGNGFKMLGASAASGFLGIVKAAVDAMAKVLQVVADGINKIAIMLKDVPFLGDLSAGLGKSATLNVKGLNDLSTSLGNKQNALADKYNLKTGADKKQDFAKGWDKMTGGGGAKSKAKRTSKTTGGGGGAKPTTGGGGGKDGGGAKQDNTLLIAELEAMKDIQDILKEMGFDVKDIKKADLFDAKRQANLDKDRKIEKIDQEKMFKEYVSDYSKTVNNNNNTNNNTNTNGDINISFNGSGEVQSNDNRINKNTRLGDLGRFFRIQQGG